MSTVETTIRNRLAELARVTRLVDELAAAHRLPPDTVADLQIALDEVLTNIISHGYADDRVHEIRIRLSVDEKVLEAEIDDDGKPFNPLTEPPPERGASLRDRRIGGLGIHFVRNLMSEVAYGLVDNRNRLVLRKFLG